MEDDITSLYNAQQWVIIFSTSQLTPAPPPPNPAIGSCAPVMRSWLTYLEAAPRAVLSEDTDVSRVYTCSYEWVDIVMPYIPNLTR